MYKYKNLINELEYINGYIWANVWKTNKIIVIDPNSGKVMKTFDFSSLDHYKGEEVLNGIAWNNKNKRIYLTGKNWKERYEFKVKKSCSAF